MLVVVPPVPSLMCAELPMQHRGLVISGFLWSVTTDLLSDTSARVVVNGSIFSPWTDFAGVRQGSVVGPLLLNILFNGIADAIVPCARAYN